MDMDAAYQATDFRNFLLTVLVTTLQSLQNSGDGRSFFFRSGHLRRPQRPHGTSCHKNLICESCSPPRRDIIFFLCILRSVPSVVQPVCYLTYKRWTASPNICPVSLSGFWDFAVTCSHSHWGTSSPRKAVQLEGRGEKDCFRNNGPSYLLHTHRRLPAWVFFVETVEAVVASDHSRVWINLCITFIYWQALRER